jgi:hypothetical protein
VTITTTTLLLPSRPNSFPSRTTQTFPQQVDCLALRARHQS